MVGRKPKPTAVKRLTGNPGKRPLNTREPKPGNADLRVPRGRLPKDAQQLWRTLAPMLDRMGVLTDADLPALEMMTLHYAVARAALAELIRDGSTTDAAGNVVRHGIASTTESADGSLKKHPAASVLRENSMAFRGYLTEFGLTPSSRVRLQVGGNEEEKSLAELLFDAAESLNG